MLTPEEEKELADLGDPTPDELAEAYKAGEIGPPAHWVDIHKQYFGPNANVAEDPYFADPDTSNIWQGMNWLGETIAENPWGTAVVGSGIAGAASKSRLFREGMLPGEPIPPELNDDGTPKSKPWYRRKKTGDKVSLTDAQNQLNKNITDAPNALTSAEGKTLGEKVYAQTAYDDDFKAATAEDAAIRKQLQADIDAARADYDTKLKNFGDGSHIPDQYRKAHQDTVNQSGDVLTNKQIELDEHNKNFLKNRGWVQQINPDGSIKLGPSGGPLYHAGSDTPQADLALKSRAADAAHADAQKANTPEARRNLRFEAAEAYFKKHGVEPPDVADDIKNGKWDEAEAKYKNALEVHMRPRWQNIKSSLGSLGGRIGTAYSDGGKGFKGAGNVVKKAWNKAPGGITGGGALGTTLMLAAGDVFKEGHDAVMAEKDRTITEAERLADLRNQFGIVDDDGESMFVDPHASGRHDEYLKALEQFQKTREQGGAGGGHYLHNAGQR